MNKLQLKQKQKRIVNSINQENLALEEAVKQREEIKKEIKIADGKLVKILAIAVKLGKEQMVAEDNIKKLIKKEGKASILLKDIEKQVDDKNDEFCGINDRMDSIKEIAENEIKSTKKTADKKLEKINDQIEEAEIEKKELLKSNKVIAGGNKILENSKADIADEIEKNNKIIKADIKKIEKNEEIIEEMEKSTAANEVILKKINENIDSRNEILKTKDSEIKAKNKELEDIKTEYEKMEVQKFAIGEEREYLKEQEAHIKEAFKRAEISYIPYAKAQN